MKKWIIIFLLCLVSSATDRGSMANPEILEAENRGDIRVENMGLEGVEQRPILLSVGWVKKLLSDFWLSLSPPRIR